MSIKSMLFAALAIVPLAACTQSSTTPAMQAQAQAPQSSNSDLPEIVVSASRTHETLRN
jgi:hypothetical protein